DRESTDFYQTMAGQFLYTPSLFLMPKKENPTHHIMGKSDVSLSLAKVYAEIFRQIQAPCLLAATLFCPSIKWTAIAKAPIYHSPPFENIKEYYPFRTTTDRNAYLLLVAVIADTSHSDIGKDLLDTVLYHNPADPPTQPLSHGHGCLLSDPVNQLDDVTPPMIKKSCHLLAEETFIQSIQGKIFYLKGVRRVE
ncbi:MAG: hypothetical protein VXZ72_02815, partial [Chlamydiota bacterium]|nr:hypothetical protein [Chlamydiota bacterium]